MDRGLLAVVVCGCVVLAGCSSAGIAGTGTEQPTSAPFDTTTPPPTETTSTADTRTNGTLEVHFINVGQSVSTLIVTPSGETMLVDTGDFTDDGKYVLQYLQRHDVDRIDHLVTSHNDADHIGGNAAIIEYYETQASGVGAVYDPGIAASTQTYEEYLDAVENYDVPLFLTLEGDSIGMEGVTVDVLGPPQPYLENRARNENSIVLKITFGETTFLLSGDAEDDQEAYLVETYGDRLDADVMKAGHHGSKSSSSGPFLDAVDPGIVVVSSAYDSRYGHPHEETLQRLSERSIPTYWTGTHGTIVLTSNGADVFVKTQAPAPTDPASLRSGSPVEPGTTDPVAPRAKLVDGELVPPDQSPGTTTVADGGTSVAVATVNADAAGDDRENLNDEYVVFENTGDQTIDLSGWTVTDESGATYVVPDGVTFGPGERVTLYTGSGSDADSELYWGSSRPIWNNGGDTITLKTPGGQVVVVEEY